MNLEEHDPSFDPEAFLRGIEHAWQRRDGEAAAAGYSPDAVLVYGNGQKRTGEELRLWPSAWFDYARDLRIKKTFRAFSGDCLASEWESAYTHPKTGQPIRERGAEFFWIRSGMVYRHHMFEHTWADGEEAEQRWPAI